MLIFVLCCALVPFIIGIVLLVVNTRDENPFEKHPYALSIALAAAFIPPILFIALDIFFVIVNYNGMCAGPPDYSAPCNFREYLDYTYFKGMSAFGYMFMLMPCIGWVVMVFGLVALYFRKKGMK